MGVQATRLVVPLARKENIVITTPASGAVPGPAPNSISIVTMMATADVHRTLEQISRLTECMQFLMEKNFILTTGTDLFVAMKITESKASIRFGSLMSEIVTGDCAITLDGALRVPGAKNWIMNAYEQTLDLMNEQDRLGA